MDVRSLQFAVTLAEELHFGRAANRHYIAAQPFGRRIQELERELGVRLFERTSRRVSLTPDGERFLPRARRILTAMGELMPRPDVLRDDSELRIGVLGFGLAERWPAARALLEAWRPGLSLTYVELDWADQFDAVRTGEVDVAIVHDIGGADDLRIEHVVTLPLVAVVPAESPLADADQLTEENLAVLPRVWHPGQPTFEDWEVIASAGNTQVRSPAYLPVAVATTGRVGIHGEPAARYFPHPQVRYVPLSGPGGRVAIASKLRDDRAQVDAFRHAVLASIEVEDLARDVVAPATSLSNPRTDRK